MSTKTYTDIVAEFLLERLEGKLAKKDKEIEKARRSEDVDSLRKQKAALRASHQPDQWIPNAARRVTQLSIVSHATKFTHPDINSLRGLYHVTAPPKPAGVLTTTPSDANTDVVGNAAALDINAFLSLTFSGKTLLEALEGNDAGALRALSPDPEAATELRDCFLEIKKAPRSPASHSRAKQLYFPVGLNEYHLLSPLFPTSLYHRLDAVIQDEKFSEGSKAARAARKNKKFHPHGYRTRPNMAIRQHGGSNQQNVSQLNAKRGGRNYLLASFPPVWNSQGMGVPSGVKSIFGRWLERVTPFREALLAYRRFIHETPLNENKVKHRSRSRGFAQHLVDEVLTLSIHIQRMDAGWSADPGCVLNDAERLWLDPGRCTTDEDWKLDRASGEWARQVRQRFGQYLNHRLGSKTRPMGDPESSFFARNLAEELNWVEKEIAHDE